MAASVEAYLTVVKKAYEGRLKLPAFQRDWKWKPSQVTLLLDSLRQGFPIGSFLFIQSSPTVDLAPRDFRGSVVGANDSVAEELVLDGQQRITAGLELFYDRGSNHYYIDIPKVADLASKKRVDLDDGGQIKRFLAELDADDGYCRRLVASNNPRSKLIDRKLLWTGLLLDDDELERCISEYAKKFPDEEKVIRYLIGRNFKPNIESNIPITTIAGNTSVEAISRIFSTLNSTGKMLTPFELVVSIMFPKDVNLNDDVAAYRELYPFYSRVDVTGDILLQTVALFDSKDTKKASLPKTITKENYQRLADDCAELLHESAEFMSSRVGLGLNGSSELLVYPVIFTPLAFIWQKLKRAELDHGQRSAAEHKLTRWFVGAVLSRRYQQSTHDKQARDKEDIWRWIEGGDGHLPDWMSETYITNIRLADPDGAVGKLFRSILNNRELRDPLTNALVGVGAGRAPSAKHHIFPTRWVNHLKDWNKLTDSANLALNLMYVEEATNGRWLNSDPREQVQDCIRTVGSEPLARQIYRAHGITDAAFEILRKPEKSRQDFFDFISEREAFFSGQLENYGFRRPAGPLQMPGIDDDDDNR
ncbi:MAG: DUF262 domain-containing protein [Novosphingobium sp.]